jgi:hypothetical protein
MPGLLRGMARTAVVAGTATAVSNRVSRRQTDRWASQEAQTYEPPPSPGAAPPAAAPGNAAADPVEQLTKLAALKEQGILTEEEFAAQKARILAG